MMVSWKAIPKMPRKPHPLKAKNGWSSERLGVRQRKLLRLMIDHGGRWAWTAWDHLAYTERQTMLSLQRKGFVQTAVIYPHRNEPDHPGRDVGFWHWELNPTRISELEEKYGMKVS